MPTTSTTWQNDIAPSSVPHTADATDGATGGDSVSFSSSAPFFEDDFSSGDTSSPTGDGVWGAPGTGGGFNDVSVTTVNPYPGDTHSLQFTFTAQPNLCNDNWAEQPFRFTSGQTEVWLEYQLYIPDGTEGFGSVKYIHRQPICEPGDPSGVVTNNKFALMYAESYTGMRYASETRRVTGDDSKLYHGFGNDTEPFLKKGTEWNTAITDSVRGKWNQIRINLRAATTKAAADGYAHIYWDGTLRCSATGLALAQDDGTNYFRKGYLMGWANSGFTETTRVWIARVKFYNTDPGW